MTLSEYIKKYRTDHDLSYQGFAKLVGLSKQYVSNLEKGINNDGKPLSPTMSTYAKIAKGTGISESALLGMLDDTVTVNPKSVNPLQAKYNALDPHGKKVVDFVLDEEYKRCIGKDETSVPKTRIVPLFRAAAGLGEPVDGVPFEDYEILAPVPGDFAVKVSGNSMEPEFHDGDIVMWSNRVPEPGEIGVVMVDGFLLVKQMRADSKGIYLHSFNKDYKDISLLYEGNDTVASYGTVIRRKK